MPTKKLTFGTPETVVPSRYCPTFHYVEGKVSFDASTVITEKTARGFMLDFPLDADEQIYGFGLQLKAFNHKGKKLVLRVNADPIKDTGDTHAPVPFFVTSHKRGFFFDTARAAEFYCGYPRINQRAGDGDSADTTDALYATRAAVDTTWMNILIPGAAGVDMYVFEGDTLTEVVAQYNMLAGGGCEVPDWGLGLLFRTHHDITEKDVLEMANHFVEHKMPVATLGLEPGWQTKHYSCSYNINRGNFPHFEDMVKQLREMGFHVNLWEQCFVHPSSPIYDEMKPYAGDFTVWDGLVPDYTNPDARKIFADWHRKTLIEKGVDGFKADECDGSDYTGSWSFPYTAKFPGGADGEQMHALLGAMYGRTVLQALDGRPTLSEIRSMGALAAPLPFVLYSDLYDHTDFIRGVVNSGFSGILWTPEVRSTASEKDLMRRMQTTVFSVHALVNAWNCAEVCPWFIYSKQCEDKVRDLLHVRESLIPRLSAAFSRYHKTGVPPTRALVMDWTDDPETYAIDDEYMFCDNLLVAPLTAASDTRRVYLPAGKWVNFFTREPVQAGWHEVTTEDIPVYELQ